MLRLSVFGRVARDVIVPLGLAIIVLGCAIHAPQAGNSLFERMGGMSILTAIAGEVVDVVSSDPATSRSFDGIKLAPLKLGIATQFCALAGGPCKYEGESMRKAHTGLKISDSQFDRLVAATRAALNKRVGEREKNEMLRLLAPMKRDIVGA